MGYSTGLFFCLLFVLLMSTGSQARDYVRGCYYTDWSYSRSSSPDGPQFYKPGMCTHIIYAFAFVHPNGTSYAFNKDDMGAHGMYRKYTDLKKKDPNLKVLLSYGGYSFVNQHPQIFSSIASSKVKTKAMIDSAIKHLRDNNFDGLDLDWEYPEGEQQKKGFVNMITAMRKAFEAEAKTSKKEKLLLTAALPAGAWRIGQSFEPKLIHKQLDLLFIMTYDLHGSWEHFVDLHAKLHSTPDEKGDKGLSTENGLKLWAEAGAPKEKLIMGIPAYSRGWTIASSSLSRRGQYRGSLPGIGTPATGASPATIAGTPGTATYFEICDYKNGGDKEEISKKGVGAYLVHKNEWHGYDNPDTIKTKMEFIKEEGYGGAFIWSMDQDDFDGKHCKQGAYPLMMAIKEGLGGNAKSNEAPSNQVPETEGTDDDIENENIEEPVSNPRTADKPDDDDDHDNDVTDYDEPTYAPLPKSDPSIHCEGKDDEYIPDPNNCHIFHHCAFGTPLKMECGKGTWFNPTYNVCFGMNTAPNGCE